MAKNPFFIASVIVLLIVHSVELQKGLIYIYIKYILLSYFLI